MTRAVILLTIGISGLVGLRVAYNLTYEPAPAVRVRWRDGTSDWRRHWLEWKYRLGDASRPEGLSYSYVLYDIRRSNIERLIRDPGVADTNDIDRERFEVPYWTASYSTQLMWAADRVPVLRRPFLRWALMAALIVATLDGLVRLVAVVARSRRTVAIE